MLLSWLITHRYLALAALCLALYASGNGRTPLWDRDEPRYCQATREMLATGDYIVPRFNGQERFNKPILIYWLMCGSRRVLADGEFAYRLPSVLAGTLTVIVTCVLGSRMFGPRVGLWAGLILAVAPLVVVESKLATPDATLAALTTLGMWALYRACTEPEARKANAWAVAFWVATAAGTLTKGPMAVVVPGMTAIVIGAVARDWTWLPKLRWRWGVPLCFALVLPWAIGIHLATDGAVWAEMVGYQFVRRVFEPVESHGAPPGFYVATLFGTFFPFSALVPAAVVWAWRHRKAKTSEEKREPTGEGSPGLPAAATALNSRLSTLDSHAVMFLFAWFVGPLAVLELARTKMVHYALPVLPPLALLVAAFCERQVALGAMAVRPKKLRFAVGIWSLAAVGGLAAALWAVSKLGDAPPVRQSVAVAMGISAVAVMCLVFVIRRQWAGLPVAVSLVAAGLVLYVAAEVIPALAQQASVKPLAVAVLQRGSARELAVLGFREPSLVYYLGGGVNFAGAGREDLRRFLDQRGGPRLIIARAENLASEPEPHSAEFKVLFRHRFFNVVKARSQELCLIERMTAGPVGQLAIDPRKVAP